MKFHSMTMGFWLAATVHVVITGYRQGSTFTYLLGLVTLATWGYFVCEGLVRLSKYIQLVDKHRIDTHNQLANHRHRLKDGHATKGFKS